MSKQRTKALPSWWRAAVRRLERNVAECDRRASNAFRRASKAKDSDDALGFALDGVLAIGEARGHANALYDLTQENDPGKPPVVEVERVRPRLRVVKS